MSDVRSKARRRMQPALCAGSGFSLIELMVALAIGAIVAATAIPAYREHVMRSHIPEATSGLLLTAMRLEQYYQDHRSYRKDDDCAVVMPASGRFSFRCKPGDDGQSFLLTATGATGELMQGFAFTLDQAGNAQTIELPDGWGDKPPLKCWITRKGAKC